MSDFVAFLFALFSHVVPLPNKGAVAVFCRIVWLVHVGTECLACAMNVDGLVMSLCTCQSLWYSYTLLVEVNRKVCLLCTALIKMWHVPSTMSPCRVARMPCTLLLLVESWAWSSSSPWGLGQRYMTRMGMARPCYTVQQRRATVMLLAMSLRTWSWILRTGPR